MFRWLGVLYITCAGLPYFFLGSHRQKRGTWAASLAHPGCVGRAVYSQQLFRTNTGVLDLPRGCHDPLARAGCPWCPQSTAGPPDFLGLPRRGISLPGTSFLCLETALADPLQQLLMVNSPDITGAAGWFKNTPWNNRSWGGKCFYYIQKMGSAVSL